MENNITAVEWLFQVWIELEHIAPEQWEMAKEMEKEQIIESWKHGNLPTFLGRVLTAEQYYNKTFKSE